MLEPRLAVSWSLFEQLVLPLNPLLAEGAAGSYKGAPLLQHWSSVREHLQHDPANDEWKTEKSGQYEQIIHHYVITDG